jgi:hypothetical protein
MPNADVSRVHLAATIVNPLSKALALDTLVVWLLLRLLPGPRASILLGETCCANFEDA